MVGVDVLDRYIRYRRSCLQIGRARLVLRRLLLLRVSELALSIHVVSLFPSLARPDLPPPPPQIIVSARQCVLSLPPPPLPLLPPSSPGRRCVDRATFIQTPSVNVWHTTTTTTTTTTTHSHTPQETERLTDYLTPLR
ncbi:hypothetical protein LX36DRAFT_210433 [Colletotrichum falcatum]|nr:hypothetical protein LX36DRAFT_210433 [Colletotrichum falcatum]